MGIGSRPAACSSCGKRLNRKQWYYRNGNYFCTRRCWVTEQEKAATEAAKAKETGKEAPPKKEEPAKEAQTAS